MEVFGLYGFGVSFISWIKTSYNNITSSVVNNGFFTLSFIVKQGVRQGDPLSPSLFIIVPEILVISIPNNRQIRAIKVNGNKIKLVAFADDISRLI